LKESIMRLIAVAVVLSSANFAVAQDSCAPATCAVPSGLCSTCGELPLGIACSSGCGGCMSCMSMAGCMSCEVPLPECGICGTARCWDCSHEEGIDVDSLTPAAQSKKLYEASLARIKFVVPEDAGVFLSDQRMSALGVERSFVVPCENVDTLYKYELKVDVVRGGKKYFKKHKLDNLQAGMILLVTVEAPPVEDGKPADIKLVAVPEAEGGKPADAEGSGDDAGADPMSADAAE
jgi:uncharacterized protein (TIGR03000 family)